MISKISRLLFLTVALFDRAISQIIQGLQTQSIGANGLSSYVYKEQQYADRYFPIAILESGNNGNKFIAMGNTNAPAIFNSSGSLVSRFCGLYTALTSEWSGFSSPTDITGPVYSLATTVLSLQHFLPSSHSPLFLGGKFVALGNVSAANHIASWDGSVWSSLAGGVSSEGSVTGMAFSNDYLYVTGQFLEVINELSVSDTRNLARWNTILKTWSTVSPPLYVQKWSRGTSVSLYGSSLLLFTGAAVVTTGGEDTILLGSFDPLIASSSLSSPWSTLGNEIWSVGVQNPHIYPEFILDDVNVAAIYSVHVTSATTLYACGNFKTGANKQFFLFWNGATWESVGAPFKGETYSAVLVNQVLVVVGVIDFIYDNENDFRDSYIGTLDLSSVGSSWTNGLTSYQDLEDSSYFYPVTCETPTFGAFYSVYLSTCSGSSQIVLGGSISSTKAIDDNNNVCTGSNTAILRAVNLSTVGNKMNPPTCLPVPTSLPTPSSKASASPTSSSSSSSTPSSSVSSSSTVSSSSSTTTSPFFSATSFATMSTTATSSITRGVTPILFATSSASSTPLLTSLNDSNSLIKAANSGTVPLSSAEISGIASAGVLVVAIFIVFIARLQTMRHISTSVSQQSPESDQKLDVLTGLDLDFEPSTKLAELASMSAVDSPRAVQLPRKPRNTLSIRNLPLTDSPEHTSLRLRSIAKSSRESDAKMSR